MQLFGNGVKRTYSTRARRYNLLAARLIADLVKGFLGPRGLEKMFIDILGEMTVTKDGATFLRKIDVEHPAAKVIIELPMQWITLLGMVLTSSCICRSTS